MSIEQVAGRILTLAALVAAAPSAANAQYYAWHSGYEWGQYDGYDQGRDEGYHYGRADGYDRGHSDGYHQAWQDAQGYDADFDGEPHYVSHCERGSGTGGLIIGALAGGLLGHEVARDGLAGTIIGGGAGALAGRAIDRGTQHC